MDRALPGACSHLDGPRRPQSEGQTRAARCLWPAPRKPTLSGSARQDWRCSASQQGAASGRSAAAAAAPQGARNCEEFLSAASLLRLLTVGRAGLATPRQPGAAGGGGRAPLPRLLPGPALSRPRQVSAALRAGRWCWGLGWLAGWLAGWLCVRGCAVVARSRPWPPIPGLCAAAQGGREPAPVPAGESGGP